MKKIKLFALMIAMVSAIFVSCDKDDDDKKGGSSKSDNLEITVDNFKIYNIGHTTVQADAKWEGTKTTMYIYSVYAYDGEELAEKATLTLQRLAQEDGEVTVQLTGMVPETKYQIVIKDMKDNVLGTKDFTTPKQEEEEEE